MSDLPAFPPSDHRRCPRLGGPVNFSYCIRAEENKPCFKILDCWWEIFDVASYLEQTLDKETFATIASGKPQPKVSSLVEMIRKAQQRLKKN